MKVIITGASGLIGKALVSALDQTGYELVRAVRSSNTLGEIPVGDLNRGTDWSEILGDGADVVVHLAACLPVTEVALRDSSKRYIEVNTLGTANLARQCALRGIKRFIFLSTVKVLGEGRDEPYKAADFAAPADAYAISKWEAEQALHRIADETGMEVVVLRSPVVYGPGVKGNFLRLLEAIDKGWFLPLGDIQNQRSLIYLANLVDAIRICLTHPKAVGTTFLVSDGDDVSTPELVRRIAAAFGRRPFLFPVPITWIRWAGRVLLKQAAVDRLLGSLCVDISPLREELGWIPPYTMQAGLEATAQWYRKTKVST